MAAVLGLASATATAICGSLHSWQMYAAIAVAAWAASAAFHARDVRVTERTDYLLADALVLFGLLVAIARASGWASRRFAALFAAYCVTGALTMPVGAAAWCSRRLQNSLQIEGVAG